MSTSPDFLTSKFNLGAAVGIIATIVMMATKQMDVSTGSWTIYGIVMSMAGRDTIAKGIYATKENTRKLVETKTAIAASDAGNHTVTVDQTSALSHLIEAQTQAINDQTEALKPASKPRSKTSTDAVRLPRAREKK